MTVNLTTLREKAQRERDRFEDANGRCVDVEAETVLALVGAVEAAQRVLDYCDGVGHDDADCFTRLDAALQPFREGS